MTANPPKNAKFASALPWLNPGDRYASSDDRNDDSHNREHAVGFQDLLRMPSHTSFIGLPCHSDNLPSSPATGRLRR